ncbi:hypothetical protein AQ505_01590 [Pedobacter sp. PACM 27299]|nr:hypothetical protein AQ505_01590 [Pedobacter sp. PACM 27299]
MICFFSTLNIYSRIFNNSADYPLRWALLLNFEIRLSDLKLGRETGIGKQEYIEINRYRNED